MLLTIDNTTIQESLTDPDFSPKSAISVSTSENGSHSRDGVVTLRGLPSTTISFSF